MDRILRRKARDGDKLAALKLAAVAGDPLAQACFSDVATAMRLCSAWLMELDKYTCTNYNKYYFASPPSHHMSKLFEPSSRPVDILLFWEQHVRCPSIFHAGCFVAAISPSDAIGPWLFTYHFHQPTYPELLIELRGYIAHR